jgi:hypothetical protein
MLDPPADLGKPGDNRSLWDALHAAGRWVVEHREEIELFGLWGNVVRACDETRLYAPASGAWHQIADATRDGANETALTTLFIELYGPGGPAHQSLCEELDSAALLRARKREVGEVLASLADGRNYVTICGALPMVEGLLADAYGKWQRRLSDYPLWDRLDTAGALTPEEEAEILLNSSALGMVEASIPEVWKSGRIDPGSVTAELNRHLILHGTGRGWDTRENAIRTVLLLAAVARVAGPLLGPR